ncbi:MAG: Uma2 family endonuclease [Chloroflexia bacterium]|nr:Uma2 family endonuclease [Chloroflexia bacterium]
MSTLTRLLTAETFALLPGSRHQELVAGEVIDHMPPGGVHGVVAAMLAALLIQWNRQTNQGFIGVESGFVLAYDPDTVRSPDVYYVRAERLPKHGLPEGFWPFAPDLGVEIVSPHDTADEVQAKVGEYLYAGTLAVWMVYPTTRLLVVHTPDGLARTYGLEATLDSVAFLPGFVLPINALF